MFATLFTDPNEKQSSATSKKIVSAFKDQKGYWEEIDFQEVEESFRSELNDEDLRRILLCIDARNTLKVMELPSTMNGHGLVPLRGSVVLEELAFHQTVSMKEVLTIIESIISKKKYSLTGFLVREKWLNTEDRELLHSFTEKHKGKLAGCGICPVFFCIGSDGQGRSCEKCGQQFCKKCGDESGYSGVEYPCDLCSRHLCGACSGGGLGCIAGGAMACSECADYAYGNY